ncbi:MAG: CCA tRNA nucleotidyltransferase [Alphaproteobacteria bacterium]|nr:CCA tRNA nucleotidyltransferase [Alphaproteobacteria bacterium]
MMRDNYLDVSKLTTNEDILELFNVVANSGGVLRFVGGAVRDALKGIKSSDLNLVTDLSPDELVEACNDAGYNTVPLGIKQGKISVIVDDTQIEVSSLGKYVEKDGVSNLEFTDNWEADASMRDLTINAVYADEKGNVFDYYNGIEDLEKGYVRFIGSASQRIKDDYSRILRYFRFYSMFGLEEPNTKAITACTENCAGLKKLPMERIKDELFKILQTKRAYMAYNLMQKNGILGYIMPDALYLEDLEYLNNLECSFLNENEALIKMFIIYRPKPDLAENMATRLKFSRYEKDMFINLAKTDFSINDFLNSKTMAKIIYEYGKDFSKAKLISIIAKDRCFSGEAEIVYDKIDNLPDINFPIKGKDIIECGLTDYQQVGPILKELEQLWIDSNFDLTREQLLLEVNNIKNVV